jgi:hypothetical protein
MPATVFDLVLRSINAAVMARSDSASILLSSAYYWGVSLRSEFLSSSFGFDNENPII